MGGLGRSHKEAHVAAENKWLGQKVTLTQDEDAIQRLDRRWSGTASLCAGGGGGGRRGWVSVGG